MAERFGRFWLHEKIGHGGMAEIFRATMGPDPNHYAFDLVIKRLHPHLQSDPAQVDMFLTEADVAKFLNHPNLVRVYEAGQVQGRTYIAMEYIWGFDIAQLLQRLFSRRMRFPSDLAVYIVMQVLRALDYVHNAHTPGGEPMDLVHRDVTPSNIYVTYRGEVKLSDFGIARVSFLEGPEEARMLKGKVFYMPPEVLGGGIVDQRVDLWGLAVTLYEMLAARRLFAGVTEADLMAGRPPPVPPPLHRVNPEVDDDLSRIIGRSLNFRTKKRPQSAFDFYRLFRAYLDERSIDVDSQALARFVRAATERPKGPAPQTLPGQGDFREQFVPARHTLNLTRRILVRKRRNALLIPLLVAGLIALGALGYAFLRESPKKDLPEITPLPEQPLE